MTVSKFRVTLAALSYTVLDLGKFILDDCTEFIIKYFSCKSETLKKKKKMNNNAYI